MPKMMISRRAKYLLAVIVFACLAITGGLYGYLARSEGQAAPAHMFFQKQRTSTLIIAHRGGAGLWPENTLHAFQQSQQLGVDIIETDVRSTKDGHLVVIHDATVERTTEGAGRVAEMTLAELKKLDAAFRWSSDGGKTFPLRGKGISVPTLQEVFAALPKMRFNIEPKQDEPSIVRPLCKIIREHQMTDKVMVGSFRANVMEEFRRECAEVATSASPGEVSKFLALHKAGLAKSFSPAMQALQVPEYVGGMHVLTADFVKAAHERNLEVHAWTVNGAEDMRRLLDIGLDGIMTDYPDRLMALLGRTPAP
jgi:glycerophosphoryl diester phosphodiesterase